MQRIRVRDFSKFPGGRFKRFGKHSGEEFREALLEALRASVAADEKLEVDLSDIYTYQPSFLDEAFAGLIKTGAISADNFKRKFVIIADRANQPYIEMIMRYVDEAAERKAGKSTVN